MDAFFPIAFTTPWILGALIVLPALWRLLRVTPPAPRLIPFPALRLLRDIVPHEETPARTPPWLLLLRLLIAALIIIGLSGPLLNPGDALPGNGPLAVIIDNGWAAARHWPERQALLADILQRAERQGRPVHLIASAPPPSADVPTTTAFERAAPGPAPLFPPASSPAEARRFAQGLAPQPRPDDRTAVLATIRAAPGVFSQSAHALWLSDGVDGPDAATLADALQHLGGLTVFTDSPERLPRLLTPPAIAPGVLTARVMRPHARAEPESVTVRMTATDGRLLARETVVFPPDARAVEVRLNAPPELRNEAAALLIEGENTAGATVLLDDRWRRRPVGLAVGRAEGEAQPLLSDLYYMERALSPYADIRRGAIETLVGGDSAAILLADVGTLTDAERAALERWIDKGGVLIRFAGPRMAQNGDSLVPTRLRAGNRSLGGALSWSEPARLAPFEKRSPFFGLTIPKDVAVSRQVLAEPSLDLAEKTWAQLTDGAPLITAARRQRGWTILVHTTAGPEWSSLALSGLYIEMLRRMVALGEGAAVEPSSPALPPLRLLDARGRLGPPPVSALPIAGPALAEQAVDARHPPGLYGAEEAYRALNLSARLPDIKPLAVPAGAFRAEYAARAETALLPWLLSAALLLAIFDLFATLATRGLQENLLRENLLRENLLRENLHRLLRGRAPLMILAAVLAGAFAAGPTAARAADDSRAIRATAETHLAYVVSGDSALDQTCRAGLTGLAEVLARRTSIETAEVFGVNPDYDELAFFPLLYWAIPAAPKPLSAAARARINAYLRTGGAILFDTRDRNAETPNSGGLRVVAEGLDIPALTPVPANHVLRRAFYLLQDFPGRFAGGDLWVEAREDRRNDGVSSVMIGGNDWAGAWATDADGRPQQPVVPGGEKQREMAYRFGVNLVMYALTGNYKADQVHVPAILERLGQ